MNFNEKMRYLRKKKEVTQQVASKKMGISISSLKNYENDRLADTKTIKLIKEYYQVSYEYLLDDDCINEVGQNIAIGKALSFSDNTIEKIKEIGKLTQNSPLESFIRETSKEKFWDRLDKYLQLSKEIQLLLPLKEMTKYSDLFFKYSTEESLWDYIDETTADFEKFYSNNHCDYEPLEKETLLECIKKLSENPIFEMIEFSDNEKYSILDYKYNCEHLNIKECITHNSLIPKNSIKAFFEISQSEINERNQEMEILGFYLSKEFSAYLGGFNSDI